METTTPIDSRERDADDKFTEPQGGLPFSALTLILIILAVTFVLLTVAISVCCTLCWKRKKKPRPNQAQNVRPNQAQNVQFYNQPSPHVAAQQGPGLGQQIVVIGQNTPHAIPMQHQPMPQPMHPNTLPRPQGPYPLNNNTMPHPQGPQRFVSPQGPTQAPKHLGRQPVEPSAPPPNGKATTLPNNNSVQKREMFQPRYLENRRSVQDHKYIKIEVPAPKATEQPKIFSDVKHDKLTEIAMLLSKAIAKTLEAISIDPDRINRKDVLGSGQYGIVYKGELANADKSRQTQVALKTVAGDMNDEKNMQEFMEEVMRMKTFSHPHVMPMLGMTIMQEKPYMVLPFMANGDLKSYISSPTRTFTVEDLLRICKQVSKGMHYLSQQNIIHADLAARNCMVDKESLIKVADFGLSRHLFQSDYYQMGNSDTLRPIRWMAPECLVDQKFSAKSDVWSYGILVWEVMTRGQRPYPELKMNDDVISELKKGYRMPCPEYTADEIYEIMCKCWDVEPKNRPSFKDLDDMIGLMIDQGGGDYEAPVTKSQM